MYSKDYSNYFGPINGQNSPWEVERLVQEGGLRFSNNKMDYGTYASGYQRQSGARNGVSRVAYLAPAVAYGIARPLYDLTIALFKGLSGEFAHSKASLYSTVRHIQEGLGWITAIFHEKMGFYMIEEARFNNACYRACLDPEIKKPLAELSDDELLKLFPDRWLDDEQEANIQALTADQVVRILPRINDYSLGSLSTEQLQALSLDLDVTILKKLFDNSPERLQKLTISQHQSLLSRKDCPDEIISLIPGESLAKLDLTVVEDPNRIFSMERSYLRHGSRATQEGRMSCLTFEQVQGIVPKLNRQTITLIPDRYLAKLGLEAVAFLKRFSLYNEHNQDLKKRALAEYTVDQFKKILPYMDRYELQFLSDEQLQSLDFSKVKGAFIDFFPYLWNDRQDARMEQTRRLALLSPETLKILAQKWGLEIFIFIPKEKLFDEAYQEVLKLAGTKDESRVLTFLEYYTPISEEKKRWAAQIPQEWIDAHTPHFSAKEVSLFADGRVDLTKLKPSAINQLFTANPRDPDDRLAIKARMAALPAATVQALLTRLPLEALPHITREQLGQLDLTDLDKERVNAIFPWSTEKQQAKQRARFSALPASQVEAITQKLDERRKFLIEINA